MKFKRNQRWKTRDGRMAVIDTVRGNNHYRPVYGRVRVNNLWEYHSWSWDGSTHPLERSGLDLISPWPKERKPREVTVTWSDIGFDVQADGKDTYRFGEPVRFREVLDEEAGK